MKYKDCEIDPRRLGLEQWDGNDDDGRDDHFHAMEVQSCPYTRTIQFGLYDHSGDYHEETPGAVAFDLDRAEEIALWVLSEIGRIREEEGLC